VELTGIGSRGSFSESLKREMLRSEAEYGSELAMFLRLPDKEKENANPA